MTDHRAILDQALSRVRSSWLLRDWGVAAARCVLVLVPLCLILGWLDYRWDFSRSTRVIELLGLVGVSVWMAWRWLIPAFTQRRDAYTAALQVESVFDQFGGRIVSRVEFRGKRGSPPGVSAELVDAACDQVERAAGLVPLAEAIDVRTARVPAMAATAVLLFLGFVVAIQPVLAGVWIERTLLPFGSAVWPRRTHITDVADSYRIRRGDSVTVTGRISGEIPRARTGELEWYSREGRGSIFSDAKVTFDIAADGFFSATVGPLLEPIKLDIEAGDASVEGIDVDVVVPPELASIEAVYTYPEFTGRQPDRVQSGDVRALVGTRVALTLQADRPIQRAELAFSGEKGDRVVSAQVTPQKQATSDFVVDGRGRYHVQLFDAYGFTSDTPATFVIDPIDNELPAIKIVRPGQEHRVTPMTRLRLVFEATDDFGVTAAVVRWKKQSAATTQPTLEEGSVSIPVGQPVAEWRDSFVWDLANASLQPDDVVEYHIEVSDTGEHLTDEKVGVSPRHVLKVVTADTLSQSLDARLRESFGELDYLTRQQAAGLDAVAASIVALPAGADPVLPADLRRVQVEVNRQARIRRQIERLSRRIGEVADDLQDSFLAEADRIADLHALSQGLAELAAGGMQQVSERLRQAQTQLRDVLAGGTEQ